MDVSAQRLMFLNCVRLGSGSISDISKRLSSGLRINSAADDPSGLALASTLKAASRGTFTAIQNIEDSLKMLDLIDSSMDEAYDMLLRIKDLAIRASNEAILRDDCQDRTKLNNEAQALIEEIDRQATSTFYNEKKILQGDMLQDVSSANDQVVYSGTGTLQATWSDTTTLTFTDEVTTSAARPGADPGGIERVFSQQIDTATNTAIGTPTQETEDPDLLVDYDGDGYYDSAATGVINDILNAVGGSAPNQIDADGDGWVAGIDNDDTDATDTGTSLTTLNANYVIPIAGSAQAQNYGLVSWVNTTTRSIGPGVLDTVQVTGAAGKTYTLQAYYSGTWNSIGSYTGNQTINFADTPAGTSSVRIVCDDPVAQIGASSISRAYNQVSLNAGAASTAPTYRSDVVGAPQNVDSLTVDVTAGVTYSVYWDNGGTPTLIGTGTGGSATVFSGAYNNASSFWVELDSAGSVTQCDASMLGVPVALTAPVAEPHTVQYDLGTAGETINRVQLTVTNGLKYNVYSDGVQIVSGATGTGAAVTHTIASSNPTSIYVELDPGQAIGNVSGVSAWNEFTLGGAATSFVDINGDDHNIMVYTLDTSAGNVAESLDRVTLTIKNGSPFYFQRSDDGVTWTTMVTATGTGAAVTYNWTNDNVVDANGDGTAYCRIVMRSGEDVATGVLAAPVITNRIDRDSDGFPDVIEVANGSNTNSAVSVPAWSLSGKPDIDGDGFLDHASYDIIYNNTYLASNNPFGYEWDGSGTLLGNPLDSAGGQYPLAGDTIDPSQVPSNVDTDGDTLPDALDPFVNSPEWTTWKDWEACFRGGSTVFISNRSTPDQAARRDVYLMNAAGDYTLLASPGDAENVMVTWDGTRAAYESGGGIWGIDFSGANCTGTTGMTAPYQITAAGSNPSWSPYNDEVVFDNGGSLYTANVATGAATQLLDNNGVAISGTNADWSPDGDNLVYEKGGSIYVYNFVTQKEYDTGLSGTDPCWSADGSKISFLSGTDIHVADIVLDKTPAAIQAFGENGTSYQLSLSLPDTRAAALGILGMAINSQDGAVAALDTVNSALETLNAAQAAVGVTTSVITRTLNDLNTYLINTESTLSSIEDADFAQEAVQLARSQILSNFNSAITAQSFNKVERMTGTLFNENLKISLYETVGQKA